MASSFFNFEETVHQSPCSSLKLFTRSRLGISLQNIASSCQSPQELISAGLWITRGNGLHLAVRLELDACVVTNLQLGHFIDGLSDILCAAKALRAHSATNGVPFYSQSGFVLALSYLESSSKSIQSNRHGLSLPANVHDVRPPSGISTACLDSIEITFRIRALLPSPTNPLKGKARSHTRQQRYGNNSRYTLRSRNAISYDEDSDRFSPPLPAKNEEIAHEHILLVSPRLDCSANDTEMMLFPDPELMPGTPYVPTPPPQPPPSRPLNLLKLIDASLRHTIGGTPALSRITKATPSDARLKKTSASPSVASVCPALFRPGYIEAIAARAPLISRIASSFATIAARSFSHPPPSEPGLLRSPAASELQPQLWHLLQKRQWPATPLEPLDCDDPSVFERHLHDQIMMFDSEDLGLEASVFGTNSPTVAVKEDEGMLVNHTPVCSGDQEMLEIDEVDEDLFSSLESTPFSSQDFGVERTILKEEGGGGEYLLLNEAESSYSSSARGIIKVLWPQDEGARDVYSQGGSFDPYGGVRIADGVSQMLF
ncbi:MAG: hypothetical protein Q9207_001144 [Kuettlingeria erythrocarpa]